MALWLKGTLKDDLERDDGPATPDYAGDLGIGYTQLKVFRAYERIRRRELADEPLFRGPYDATTTWPAACWRATPPPACAPWPRNLQMLLVDEMHDMNAASFRVLRELLIRPSASSAAWATVTRSSTAPMGPMPCSWATPSPCTPAAPVARLPLTPSHRFGRKLATKAGRLADKPYGSLAAHDTAVQLLGYDDEAECVDTDRPPGAALAHRHARQDGGPCRAAAPPGQSIAIENRLLADGVPYTVSGFESYLLRPEVLLVRGLLAVATDNFDSVTEPRTREKLMRALVFFCGARIVVKGREHESQHDLLADAIRSVTDNPLFWRASSPTRSCPTSSPPCSGACSSALKVAKEAHGPGHPGPPARSPADRSRGARGVRLAPAPGRCPGQPGGPEPRRPGLWQRA